MDIVEERTFSCMDVTYLMQLRKQDYFLSFYQTFVPSLSIVTQDSVTKNPKRAQQEWLFSMNSKLERFILWKAHSKGMIQDRLPTITLVQTP